MSTATITSKGQVTIPKGVRDRMGLKPGDQIVFFPSANGRAQIVRKRPISDLFGCIPSNGVRLTDEEIKKGIEEGAVESGLGGIDFD